MFDDLPDSFAIILKALHRWKNIYILIIHILIRLAIHCVEENENKFLFTNSFQRRYSSLEWVIP